MSRKACATVWGASIMAAPRTPGRMVAGVRAAVFRSKRDVPKRTARRRTLASIAESMGSIISRRISAVLSTERAVRGSAVRSTASWRSVSVMQASSTNNDSCFFRNCRSLKRRVLFERASKVSACPHTRVSTMVRRTLRRCVRRRNSTGESNKTGTIRDILATASIAGLAAVW